MTDLITLLSAETTVPRWHEMLLIVIIGWDVLMHSLRGTAWALLRLAEGLDSVAKARLQETLRQRWEEGR